MNKIELSIIIYIITILLSVMYATQPLQPLLANEFNITITQASSFTAVIMFFLAVSPIVYGYILEHVHAKRVLFIALSLLLVTNLFLSFSNSYEYFLTIRIIEAIIIPAILTACMSILASDIKNSKKNMSIYVASTVFGGLIGRIFSGYIATGFSWQAVFLSLSFGLLISIVLLRFLSHDVISKPSKAKMGDFLVLLKDKRLLNIYLLMFLTFFVFAGILNVLPFRIKDENPDITEAQIGLLYLGYGVGIIVSLFIHKIVNIYKNELNVILSGIVLFFIATALLLVNNSTFTFLMIFVFCMGMFTIHTLSTRIASSLYSSKKALTSGMYLSFYYIGGTFGSIIPPLIYSSFGWEVLIYICLLIISFSFLLLLNNKKQF